MYDLLSDCKGKVAGEGRCMSENHQSIELKGKIEALLFAASRPLSVKTRAKILQLETERVELLLAELSEDLRSLFRNFSRSSVITPSCRGRDFAPRHSRTPQALGELGEPGLLSSCLPPAQ